VDISRENLLGVFGGEFSARKRPAWNIPIKAAVILGIIPKELTVFVPNMNCHREWSIG
jgi:hypothetical protein